MFEITIYHRAETSIASAQEATMPEAFRAACLRIGAAVPPFPPLVQTELDELFAQARAGLAYRPSTVANYVEDASGLGLEIRRVEP